MSIRNRLSVMLKDQLLEQLQRIVIAETGTHRNRDSLRNNRRSSNRKLQQLVYSHGFEGIRHTCPSTARSMPVSSVWPLRTISTLLKGAPKWAGPECRL